MDFLELKKNLKSDVSNFKQLKVSLLGDSPTQMLSIALKGYGVHEKFNIDLYEAEYNQIDANVLNLSSELYESKSEFTIIFESTEKLIQKFYALDKDSKKNFAANHLEKVSDYFDNINSQYNTSIIYFNFAEINDNVFGNYSNKIDFSFLYQLRKINFGLMDLCQKYKNVHLCDVSSLQNRIGRNSSFSPSVYTNSSIVHSIEFLPLVSKSVFDIIKTIKGKIVKCIILDLDNTLWGGIIGDDGIDGIQIGNLGIGETFSKFQAWIKQLKERGIILAVCSKNEESIAKEPFEKHADMILRLDDISVFVANWENKASNIQEIQSILNIGFDSMVFIDDNPVERKIVRENISDIIVPEMPEDPAEYLSYLQSLNLFETVSVTDEDEDRTKKYQEEAKRNSVKKNFVNEDEFLQSLNMVCEFGAFKKSEIPRLSQLSQRSNQFNLRTVRYTEEDIAQLIDNTSFNSLSFKLRDSYGDYGLVSMVVLEKKENNILFIDTWLMSCRVLKRGLEHFVLNEVVNIAKKNNCDKIIGEYIPTAKNAMVKNHYSTLGFDVLEENKIWVLDSNSYQNKIHFIKPELI